MLQSNVDLLNNLTTKYSCECEVKHNSEDTSFIKLKMDIDLSQDRNAANNLRKNLINDVLNILKEYGQYELKYSLGQTYYEFENNRLDVHVECNNKTAASYTLELNIVEKIISKEE